MAFLAVSYCKNMLLTLVVVLVILCDLLPCIETAGGSSDVAEKGENNGCSSVKLAWGTNGLGNQMVPQSPMPGTQLQICSQHSSTCCTRDMENKLSIRGRQTLNRTVSEKIGLVRDIFVSRTTRYSSFCNDLISRSSQDLNEMFIRTYGDLYANNTMIFTQLFVDFKSYFEGGNIDISELMDAFFSRLSQRMFVLLNSQYSFNEHYLSCIYTHIGTLSPLGDVPQQLGVQVKRAFIAARTFYQGLMVGRNAIFAISTMEPTDSCVNAVTRMLQCPLCHENSVSRDLRPCSTLCMNVMRGCLAQHFELTDAWNSYIDAMIKVANRLESSFNIENVVRPINVKISDAIMNFQEASATVSEKLFEACGQPPLDSPSRLRRSAFGHQGAGGKRRTNQDDASSRISSYEQLITDIRERLSTTQDFWRSLPDEVCNTMAAPLMESANCWNGVTRGRYTSPIVDGGLLQQANNTEVTVDVRRKSAVVSQQIFQLRTVTSKLHTAHNGRDVDWQDMNDEDLEDGSGVSGDGDNDQFSGSGVGSDDIDIIGRYDPTRDHGLSFTQPTRAPIEVVTHRRLRTQPTESKPTYLRPTTKTPSPASSAVRSTTCDVIFIVSLLNIVLTFARLLST